MEWIIERGNNSNFNRFREAVLSCNFSIQEHEYIPFSDNEVICNNPCFLYGSVNLRDSVMKKNVVNNMCGICSKIFSISDMNEKYKEKSLNFSSEILTVKEFIESGYKNDDIMFVRPDLDSKKLNGSVDSYRHHKDNVSVSLNRVNGLLLTDKLVVAKPINILEEYRCFIVNKKVVSCSQYMKNRKLHIQSKTIPTSITEFANNLCNVYSPEPAFVLDIGVLENDDIRSIEFNSINCSGLYDCDPKKIVLSIASYIKNTMFLA